MSYVGESDRSEAPSLIELALGLKVDLMSLVMLQMTTEKTPFFKGCFLGSLLSFYNGCGLSSLFLWEMC